MSRRLQTYPPLEDYQLDYEPARFLQRRRLGIVVTEPPKSLYSRVVEYSKELMPALICVLALVGIGAALLQNGIYYI